MSNLGGGDQLASGARSAQFAGGASSLTQFEDDLIFRPEIVKEKYGLSDAEIEQYKEQREKGEKLPDLVTAEERNELSGLKINVIDRRPSYIEELHPLAAESKAVVRTRKYADKQYGSPRPILDRVLVKTIPDDPNLEVLEDGSMRDKRTGFIIPPQYRQHSKIGIVLAIGDFVVMGGVKTDLNTFIRPGDKVTYGDYNSEILHLADAKVEALCDAVQLDFESDPEGLRIVRIQDVRMIERPLAAEANDGGGN